jgi:AraC-like DNA-binding protein
MNLEEIGNESNKECCWIHDVKCNQKYGGEFELPYSFHLKATAAQALKYEKLFSIRIFDDIFSACFGHDLIEDARMSYNDVKELFDSKIVADIIYACTEEKGHNRGERHSDKFFQELSENRLAVFVKLCDVTANVIFSILTGSGMLGMYKKEFPNLKEKLYIPGEYDLVWKRLEILLSAW